MSSGWHFLLFGHGSDGNLASRCEDKKFPGKPKIRAKFFYQRNSFVYWNFVFHRSLSTANTQPHTIVINSHSYFFPFPLLLICLISLVKSTVCACCCERISLSDFRSDLKQIFFGVIRNLKLSRVLSLRSRSHSHTRFRHDSSFRSRPKPSRVQELQKTQNVVFEPLSFSRRTVSFKHKWTENW